MSTRCGEIHSSAHTNSWASHLFSLFMRRCASSECFLGLPVSSRSQLSAMVCSCIFFARLLQAGLLFLAIAGCVTTEAKLTHVWGGASKIFIGDISDATDAQLLKDHGISHVINLTPKPFSHPGVSYLQYAVKDVVDKEDTAYAFLEKAVEKSESTLVHCFKGCKGAGAAVMAYLIRKNQVGFEAAYRQVERTRPCVAELKQAAGLLSKLQASNFVVYPKCLELTNKTCCAIHLGCRLLETKSGQRMSCRSVAGNFINLAPFKTTQRTMPQI